MIKITVFVGCRSDRGLSAPIIIRLRLDPFFEVYVMDLDVKPSEATVIYQNSYKAIQEHIKIVEPELFVIVGDRIEATACACCAFHNNIKIAHVYAGIVGSFATFDSVNRHVITLWADITFCEDENSALRVFELWSNIEKIDRYLLKIPDEYEQFNIYNCGITHLDDLEIDENLKPKESYDLVLINPTTLFAEALNIKKIRKMIIIGSNPDRKIPQNCDYDNLPRPQFLGLLKNCVRFITNSSSAYYEAPYFLKPEQIILVGKRNKNRSTPKKLETGASSKIVKIIKKWWLENGL